MGHVLSYLITNFIAISGVLVALGWRQILKGRREAHQETMLWAAAFATLFFIIYVAKSALFGGTHFGGPDSLKPAYFTFLITHTVLATVAAIFGITTLVLAYRKRYAKHRKLGRITAVMWFITVITGIVVYILLYILYPGGDTAGLLDTMSQG